MSNRLHKWLIDIILAIDEIEGYYIDDKTFEFFKSDKIRKKASERNLEIIGEAMNRILSFTPTMLSQMKMFGQLLSIIYLH